MMETGNVLQEQEFVKIDMKLLLLVSDWSDDFKAEKKKIKITFVMLEKK